MPSVTEILDTMDYGPAPEANGHVLDWLKAHEQGFGHFINAAFTKPAKLFDVANPATGQPLAHRCLQRLSHQFSGTPTCPLPPRSNRMS